MKNWKTLLQKIQGWWRSTRSARRFTGTLISLLVFAVRAIELAVKYGGFS